MSFGSYTPFIMTSYLLVTAVVVMLIIWIGIDYHRQKRQLRALETDGIIRRSGRGATETK
jgi:heme exporter protein D